LPNAKSTGEAFPPICLDACTNDPGTHDAWPLDNDIDTEVSVTGDVWSYVGRIGATSGSPNWSQRLDLNMDSYLTVVGDVLMYRGSIGGKPHVRAVALA